MKRLTTLLLFSVLTLLTVCAAIDGIKTERSVINANPMLKNVSDQNIENSTDGINLEDGDYVINFEPEDDFTGWMYQNSNLDNRHWSIYTNKGIDSSQCAAYVYNADTAANDWITSPAFSLKTGISYTVSFYYCVGMASYPEKLAFYYGTDNTQPLTTIVEDFGEITNETYTKTTYNIQVDQDNDYYFGWYCYSDANQYCVCIDSVYIKKTASSEEEEATWDDPSAITYNSSEADMIYRIGDIDNLGFGWADGFDPFSGNSTSSHSWPFTQEDDDPAGTDKIMVVSSYDYSSSSSYDGYTNATSRPGNTPTSIDMTFDLKNISIQTVVLQMFVDDFQATYWGADYKVTIDDVEIPELEEVINSLVQTGPIGKLITVQLHTKFNYLFEDGAASIYIDDKTTGAGDGYGIDFARILINRKNYNNTGSISGSISANDNKLEGVSVEAAGYISETTDVTGNYTLTDVPAGMILVKASKEGYKTITSLVEVKAGENSTLNLVMEKLDSQTDSITTTWTDYTTQNTGSNGIINNEIHCTLKDSKGNLWIGTEKGVTCYDGTSYTSYSSNDISGLYNVSCIFEDNSGRIWISANYCKIFVFEDGNFTKYTSSNGLSSYVYDINQDANGTIWIAYHSSIASFNDTSSFAAPTNLPEDVGYSITFDTNGTMWIGGEAGLTEYDGTTFSTHTTDYSYNSDLQCDSDGNIWLSHSFYGISKYDGSNFTYYTKYNDGILSNYVRNIATDNDGNVWFATSSGLMKYDGNSFSSIDPDGMTDDNTQHLFIYNTNEIYVSTNYGLNIYNGSDFIQFTTQDGLVDNYIKCMGQDKDGNMYFGTSDYGLSMFDGQNWTWEGENAGNIPDDNIYCFYKDSKDAMWIGTYDGLVKYDGTTYTEYTTSDGLAGDLIRDIGEDESGNIWIACNAGGISKYDGASFTNYQVPPSGTYIYYNSIATVGNSVYVGTDNNGIYYYDGTSWTIFTTENSNLQDNENRYAFTDSENNVWFSNDYSGITKYDGSSFTSFSTSDILEYGSYKTITEDNDGNIWAANYGDGAVKYDGTTWTYYTVDSGLISNSVATVFCDDDGALWFGTYYGVTKMSSNSSETEPALTANFEATTSTTGKLPFEVTFSSTSTGNITTYTWDFGDGTTESSFMGVTAHTYTTAGTYSVKLLIENTTSRDSIIRTNYITVLPSEEPPTVSADFSVNATGGEAPLTVQFTDASTGAIAWEWDFDNDGTTDATDQNPSYTYTETGTYSVKLSINDGTNSDEIVKTDLITVSMALDVGWNTIESGTTENLTDVVFPTATTGFAAGENGIILKTTDAGLSWQQLSTPLDYDIYDIDFYDDNHGWAVGKNGTILYTTDAGENWTSQKLANVTSALYGIEALSDSNGYICGYDGLTMYRGVNNWIWHIEGNATFRTIEFANENIGWIAGNSATIYKTTDGGNNWTQQTIETTNPIYQLNVFDTQKIIALDSYGKIFKTTDGGENWTQLCDNTSYLTNGMHFVAEDYGWIVYYTKSLYTTDGGITWIAYDTNCEEKLKDVKFTSKTSGCAVGDNGTILLFRGDPTSSNISESNINTIMLTPNPAKNIVSISTEDAIQHIDIFSLNGQIVLRQQINNQTNCSINTSQLNNGIYIVRIKTVNGTDNVQLVISK